MPSLRLALGALLLAAGSVAAQDYPLLDVDDETIVVPAAPAPLDRFGGGLASEGVVVAIGSPGFNGQAGKIDVFERTGSASILLQSLQAPFPKSREAFGAALDMTADTLVVGAPFPDWPSASTGRVFVYERAGCCFFLAQILTSESGLIGDQFGRSVAVKGDRIIVGAPFDDDLGAQSGSAFVFDRDGGGVWHQTAQLLADDGQAGDQFGIDVALSDDRVLVGAWLSDAAAVDGGAGYLFSTGDGVTWQLEQQLLAPSTEALDEVGSAVALAGIHAFLGAPGDDQTLDQAGVVHEYLSDGGGSWDFVASLQHSGQAVDGRFGAALDANGELLIVGNPGAASGAGRAVLYQRQPSGSYTVFSVLEPGSAAEGDAFGRRVTAGSKHLLVAAPDADGAVASSGAVSDWPILLAGIWTDVGGGVDGSAGASTLVGTGTMLAGEPFEFTITNAVPSGTVFFFIGFSALGVPFKGGVFWPAPDFLTVLPTNGLGGATFGGDWPVGHPGPYSAWFQAWWPDVGAVKGFAATNGVRADVAP